MLCYYLFRYQVVNKAGPSIPGSEWLLSLSKELSELDSCANVKEVLD